MQKEIVLLTSDSHKSVWEKVILPSNSPIFIQTTKPLGFPLGWSLGSPNCLISQFCPFLSAHDSYNALHFGLRLMSTS